MCDGNLLFSHSGPHSLFEKMLHPRALHFRHPHKIVHRKSHKTFKQFLHKYFECKCIQPGQQIHIDCLVQDCSNSIVNILELLQSCTKPSICFNIISLCCRWHGTMRSHAYVYSRDILLSGVPDFFDRSKILSGYDLSHYQVPHCIKSFLVFFFYLCLFITIFNFILNYVPTVTFWIFTYHKIWNLLIIFCFIWNYWII